MTKQERRVFSEELKLEAVRLLETSGGTIAQGDVACDGPDQKWAKFEAGISVMSGPVRDGCISPSFWTCIPAALSVGIRAAG
jgi:hypothetical protein